jgi:CO/xanthine dehydrogenase Mo-binding subunit|tara:strand:+ start:17224 stop:19422 length:2199 start_codon:yes stop_codon:yes gene_type:complete
MSTLIQTRRGFLKTVALAGGGLALGFQLTGCSSKAINRSNESQFMPNAFIQITPDNTITFFMPRAEMGQGILDGLTTIIAEEMDVSPQAITVLHAGVDKAYGNPDLVMQVTGGSTSIKAHYQGLREAGATVKAMLVAAAVADLGINASELTIENGNIITHDKTYSYGEFAISAGMLAVPEQIELKDSKDFSVIGKNNIRLDVADKVDGTAVFGIDIDFDGLHSAALKRCPVIGGTVKSFDAGDAERRPGVKAVVEIFNGIAVVADNYWQAKSALQVITVEWDLPALAKISSSDVKQQYLQALDEDEGKQWLIQGDEKTPFENLAKIIEADYSAPYLAHATMEPMNCTVKIDGDKCDIWVPTQAPDIAQGVAAFYCDVDKDSITIHSTLIGGGFGRRANQDYVAEAVSIAVASQLPVQLVWSREDDMQHDYYRPATMVRYKAGFDDKGQLQSLYTKAVGPNLMPYMMDSSMKAFVPDFVPDGMVNWMSKRGFDLYGNWLMDEASVEGLYEDYEIPNKEVRHVTVDPGLRVGYWRSVGHSFSGFFKEGFVDELVFATGKDPLQFRLDHTQDNPRLNGVIKAVGELANWQQPREGRFLGIAAHESFHSFVAEIAEVSVEAGKLVVHKVYCAVDCGVVINPDTVVAQMEGGIIFGMTAALYGDISLKDGMVEQTNFHNYQIVRMPESPAIEVVIVASDEKPTGVGEISVPPIAGAIANAIFAATGQRLRELPLKLA